MKDDKKKELLAKVKDMIQEQVKAYKDGNLKAIKDAADRTSEALEEVEFDLEMI